MGKGRSDVNPILVNCPRCFVRAGYQCVGKKGPRKSCHQARWSAAREEAVSLRFYREPIGWAMRKAVWERDEYRCKHCGTHIDLTCDHITPVSRGGETRLSNLQTLCRPCNSRKGNR